MRHPNTKRERGMPQVEGRSSAEWYLDRPGVSPR